MHGKKIISQSDRTNAKRNFVKNYEGVRLSNRELTIFENFRTFVREMEFKQFQNLSVQS